MELSQRGPESETLLRSEQKNPVVMPQNSARSFGWDGLEPEKNPFLRNEPVKLTPAWEGSNLPNDTLNLKGIAMDLAPPKDKWNLIYVTLILHGLGTLTAWNMFITAERYFKEYKLRNSDSDYVANFHVYIGVASQLPNLLFNWFNVFIPMGGDLTSRIVWSLCAEVLIFCVTVVLAMIDTSDFTNTFFWITVVSVFLLNAFNAIFQNSVYGLAARLPPAYTGAVVLGSNVCGTLVVLLSWATDVFSSSPRTAAIYYFIGGMFVLLICFDTYFALPLNRFYRYHETLSSRSLRVNPALAATPPPSTTPYARVFAQSAPHLYNVFITMFVSLAIFPRIQTDVKPVTEGFLGANFNRVTCYLTFNVCAMLGNITASLVQFPRPRFLWLLTTSRILLVPLLLLCNYQPGGRTLPVLVQSDAAYWILGALVGWSGGHCSSLAMMYTSRTVAPENAGTAGMMGAAMLITGIFTGIVFSLLNPIIVSLQFWTTI